MSHATYLGFQDDRQTNPYTCAGLREELLKTGIEVILASDVDVARALLTAYISATVRFRGLGL